MAFSIALPWAQGEEDMQHLMNVPEMDNPTSSMLTPQAAFMLMNAPLLAIGTIDQQGRPWTSIWGGDMGFAQPLGGSAIGVKTTVDRINDPVVQELMRGKSDGEIVKEEGKGRMIGGLTINLETRKRVKLYGRMIAGVVSPADDSENDEDGARQLQLAVNIEQSLGNCPKYLNKKHITAVDPKGKLLSQGSKLSPEAVSLLSSADLFFISSSNGDVDMDTNHRGGPPGFVRVVSNNDDGAEIVYPEYSGNRLYQTLGNLRTTPLAGLVFPHFESGDVLYLTGKSEILVGDAAAALLPRSNLAVKIKITEARFVRQGLPFRGVTGEFSPYNPKVRLLAKEDQLSSQINNSLDSAILLQKTSITPNINRYRFKLAKPATYQPGQWVALDFSEDLDIGYSHMRDDDPKSLNDDYIRTFTVSSYPDLTKGQNQSEFEITVRKAGPVTSFLAMRRSRHALEVGMRGFGGDFKIETNKKVAFVAGGVGITPVLGQIPDLDMANFSLVWTLRTEDVGLALDTFKTHPKVAASTRIFLTGQPSTTKQRSQIELILQMGAHMEHRRVLKQDIANLDVETWYTCTSKSFKGVLLQWLEGKHVVYENFDY